MLGERNFVDLEDQHMTQYNFDCQIGRYHCSLLYSSRNLTSLHEYSPAAKSSRAALLRLSRQTPAIPCLALV